MYIKYIMYIVYIYIYIYIMCVRACVRACVLACVRVCDQEMFAILFCFLEVFYYGDVLIRHGAKYMFMRMSTSTLLKQSMSRFCHHDYKYKYTLHILNNSIL